MMLGLSTNKVKSVTDLKTAIDYQISGQCDVILNLAYHVAFINDIHTEPSISEHQLLIADITKNIFEVSTVIFILSILFTWNATMTCTQ